MNHTLLVRLFSCVLVAVALAGSPAVAGVITQDLTLPETIDNSTTIAIDRFNPAVGDLTEVQISFDVLAVSSLRITTTARYGARETVYFSVSSDLAVGSYLDGTLTGSGTAQFDSPPGRPGTVRTAPGFAFVSGQASVALTNPISLAAFLGGPSLPAQMTLPLGVTPLMSPTFAISDTTTRYIGQLTISYLYTDPVQDPVDNHNVPEPKSIAVFAFGALMLVGQRRLRKPSTTISESESAS